MSNKHVTAGKWIVTTDKFGCILIVPEGYVKDRHPVIAKLDWNLDEIEAANADHIVELHNNCHLLEVAIKALKEISGHRFTMGGIAGKKIESAYTAEDALKIIEGGS